MMINMVSRFWCFFSLTSFIYVNFNKIKLIKRLLCCLVILPQQASRATSTWLAIGFRHTCSGLQVGGVPASCGAQIGLSWVGCFDMVVQIVGMAAVSVVGRGWRMGLGYTGTEVVGIDHVNT